ncbi:MAG: helix-turn-helix transcriptional regulator [Pseudonocardia sp.]|nr:helix-turn-helix transcriptional regulator [Pseudonocardia sp.]
MTTRPVPRLGPRAGALERLGTTLRAVREEAGLTGTELAEALGTGWSQPKISKIETGRQLPTGAEILAWAAAAGAEAEPLTVLRAEAALNGSRGSRELGPADFTHIAEFQPLLVPRLLQTAAYLRHLLVASHPAGDGGSSAEALGHIVATELRVQAILHEPGREFVHVMMEAALRLRVGAMTFATLRGQLLHLAELATLPSHTFAVLPFSTACPIPPGDGFALYDREIVRLGSADTTVDLSDAATVARYSRALDRLIDISVTGTAAAAICRAAAAALPG